MEPQQKRNRLSLKKKKRVSEIKDSSQTGEGIIATPPDSPFVIDQGEENFFTLEIVGSKSFHESEAAKEITYRAKFLTDLAPHLYALFPTLIDEMIAQYGLGGIARIFIDHPNLEKAIIVVPTPIGKLFVKDILDHIDSVVNSAGDIPADEALDINVAVIKQIQGQGRKHVFSTDDFKLKISMVESKTNDNFCLTRAIIIGMAHLEKNLHSNTSQKSYCQKQYDRLRNNRQNNLH